MTLTATARELVGRRSPLVLNYHGVGDRPVGVDPDHLFVPAAMLRAQLESLLGAGWRPLTLDEYLAGGAGRRRFLLTFDDGYRSMVEVAAPLLQHMGVPSVCFVLPGRWGGAAAWNTANPDEPLLDIPDLARLEAAGMRLELHGWDHASLPGLPAGELHRQVHTAAEAFTTAVGRPPRVFAYAYGAHDAAARAAVRAAGLELAVAVYDGLPSTHPDARFAIPRVDVNALDTPRTMRLKTLRTYPAIREALGRAPALRRGLHAFVGTANRSE